MREAKKKDIVELFNELYTYVYTIAIRNIRNESDAEDVCSEVFISIHKSIDEFEPKAEYSYRAWIKKITVNKVINFVKSRGYKETKKAIPFDEVDNIKDIIPDSAINNNHNDIAERIEEIEHPIIKEIAKKLYYEEKTMDEIAKELNIPPGTLRRRLYDYRKRYQKKRAYE